VFVSSGSYSEGIGLDVIRKDVALFISKRDGVNCNVGDVFLCPGAASGIAVLIFFLIFSFRLNMALHIVIN
jgi:alanine transaminase